MSVTKKLILEFDDLHWKHPENCLESIEYLVSMFPNIKLNFFTTPKMNDLPISMHKKWCKKVIELIEKGNIKLAVHGLTHSQLECINLDLDQTLNLLKEAERYFEEASLPFTKVFRAPYWGINKYTLNALVIRNYTHIYNHEDYNHFSNENIRSVYYSWNLKDDIPPDTEYIVAHGHTHDVCNNGIKEVTPKIINFINQFNPEFLYVNDI